MSDKHITEPPWKALVAKHKVKDPGLGKALAALAKLDDKNPGGKLAALPEIEKQAQALAKEHKKGSELAEYLDVLLEELVKQRKALAVLAKAAARQADDAQDEDDDDDSEEDAEAAEYKKDLKKKLIASMNQVRNRAAEAADAAHPDEQGKPPLRFMAYLMGVNSSVLVARRISNATKKLLLPLAQGVKGGKFIAGDCVFENNMHTFIVEKNPGGLAKALARALKAETGQKYKVRVRTLDGQEEAEEGNDAEGVQEAAETGAATAPAAAEMPAATGADDALRAQWLQLKELLLPDVKQALAANPANKAQIAMGVAEANQQEKAGNFAAAIAAFEALRPLLVPAPATPAATAADFTARLKTLAPRLAGGARNPEAARLTAQMQALAKSQDIAGAMALLLQIEALLDTGGGSDRFPALWAAARQGWFDASEAVDAQIGKLQHALKGQSDAELQAIAEFGLNALTRNHKVPLLAAIRDVDGANAGTRAALAKKARVIVESFENHVQTDERIAACDGNPFGVTMSIQARIGPALAGLATALAAA